MVNGIEPLFNYSLWTGLQSKLVLPYQGVYALNNFQYTQYRRLDILLQ